MFPAIDRRSGRSRYTSATRSSSRTATRCSPTSTETSSSRFASGSGARRGGSRRRRCCGRSRSRRRAGGFRSGFGAGLASAAAASAFGSAVAVLRERPRPPRVPRRRLGLVVVVCPAPAAGSAITDSGASAGAAASTGACSSDFFRDRNQRKRNLLRARALQQRLLGRRRGACAANSDGRGGTSRYRLATGAAGPDLRRRSRLSAKLTSGGDLEGPAAPARITSGPGPTLPTSATGGEPVVAGQREAHELLLIEEADAWFEYLEATRAQSALRYKEVEPWAWARLSQRLRAIRTKKAKLRPAPTVARISGARCASTSSPYAEQIRRTIRSWFSVSTGRSAPGTNTATASKPFLRANDSISSLQNTRRSTGKRRASDEPSSSSLCISTRAISSTGKPLPVGTRTTSVARTNGIRAGASRPAATTTVGTRARCAALRAFSSCSVTLSPTT